MLQGDVVNSRRTTYLTFLEFDLARAGHFYRRVHNSSYDYDHSCHDSDYSDHGCGYYRYSSFLALWQPSPHLSIQMGTLFSGVLARLAPSTWLLNFKEELTPV